MGKFIIFTFLMLGLAFYELSGGADFVPQSRDVVAAASDTAQSAEPEVTRAASTDLVSISLPVTDQLTTTAADDTAAQAAVFEASVAPAAPVQEEPAEVVAVVAPDLRYVAGTRVNLREGPGTNFSRIVTLTGGTATEVLMVDMLTGWAQVRLPDTGVEGWIAERLLTD